MANNVVSFPRRAVESPRPPLTNEVSLTLDVFGRVTSLDPLWSSITGMPFEECVEGKWIDLLHPDDALAYTRKRYKALASGRVFCGETRIRIANGEYIHIKTTLRPILDLRGQISHWAGTIAFAAESLSFPLKVASGN